MRRTGVHPALVGLSVLAVATLLGCGRSEPQSSPAKGGPTAGPVTQAPAGAQTSAAPSRASVDACALVTKPEAEKLAGTPLNDAKPVRETCTYTGPVSGPTAQVEVFVGDGAKKFLDIDRDLGHDLKPVPGVGDEAYAEDGAVFVNKSGVWVSIRLTRLNDPAENRKPLEDVARTVATRL